MIIEKTDEVAMIILRAEPVKPGETLRGRI